MEALTGGLVGHYELGEDIKPHCIGVDHGGQDWTPSHDSVISGKTTTTTMMMIFIIIIIIAENSNIKNQERETERGSYNYCNFE